MHQRTIDILSGLFPLLSSAGKRGRGNDFLQLSAPQETMSLSLVDSDSNSLSVGSKKERIGKVSCALEVAGEIQLFPTGH